MSQGGIAIANRLTIRKKYEFEEKKFDEISSEKQMEPKVKYLPFLNASFHLCF